MGKYPINKKKQKRRKALFFSLLAAFFVWTGWTYAGLSGDIKSEKRLFSELAEEQQALLQERAQLNRELSKMDDPEYIAELARKQYFLTNEGEILFITTPEKE